VCVCVCVCVCVQWTDKAAYKETLLRLAGLFKKNFEVFASYKIGDDSNLTDEILAAGPNF
jgi:phosphoenolpyruvate carboxykinase (ATP)